MPRDNSSSGPGAARPDGRNTSHKDRTRPSHGPLRVQGGVRFRNANGERWTMHPDVAVNHIVNVVVPQVRAGASSSTPTTGDADDGDKRPRPDKKKKKAQQQQPDLGAEDQVYEAAFQLKAQAKRCAEAYGTIMADYKYEMERLVYVDQEAAEHIWKLKLKKLSEKGQDKDKHINLQYVSLGGCFERMSVAAHRLSRQITAEGGDWFDPRQLVLTQLKEHRRAIKTLLGKVESGPKQCEQLVKELQDLDKLLETEEGDKPFALFRFGRTGSQNNDSQAEQHQQYKNAQQVLKGLLQKIEQPHGTNESPQQHQGREKHDFGQQRKKQARVHWNDWNESPQQQQGGQQRTKQARVYWDDADKWCSENDQIPDTGRFAENEDSSWNAQW